MADVLILAGARTPFAAWGGGVNGRGEKGGALKALDPFDLGAAALKGALERAGLEAAAVERVVFGNAYHVGPHACYGARYVAHRAGLPPERTALTVNLACGAGLLAVITAAQEAAEGRAGVVAAVGADAASLVPRAVFVPSFKDASCGEHIAVTAQEMAAERGLTRADQDAWSLESHRRALAARGRGVFADELVSAGGLTEDDAVLADPKPAFFAESKLLFEGGTVTHANTHGVVDGGSALLLASAAAAAKLPRPPLGRYLGGVVVGLPPRRMAYASVPAVRSLLSRLGLAVKDFDLFEINETFAAQTLIDMKELGIPPERINPNGGAIALGHPFAGTGARLVHTLLLELKRRGLRRGLASICVGGGQGVAVAVEAL